MTRVANLSLVAMLLSSHATFSQNSTRAVATSEQGKTIFVNRCAKCHDADASRNLPDGTTLLGRLAEKLDRRAALATRLKDAQERDAVFLYLEPLVEQWRPPHGQHTPASPRPSPEP